MIDDPDHDHDSRANGDRPPRAVCIHDPLAITPADAPRGKDWLEPSPISPRSVHRVFDHDAPRVEVLAALAEAEADEPHTVNPPNELALELQRAHEALGRERTALCEMHIAVREWLTDPSGASWVALAAVHPDVRRALDGWTTAGARMRPEATVKGAPYSWVMRDLSAPDAVTRYTLARRRDNLVLVVDAHDDRRRIRDLEGMPLPSTIEVDELAAGDPSATPDLLATIEDTLGDMAPEGHEVERVMPLPCTRGFYGSIHRCVTHDGAWMIGDTNRCERTAPVTAGEIARLRALYAAALGPPWTLEAYDNDNGGTSLAIQPLAMPCGPDDGALIVALHGALPRLLGALEAERASVAAAKLDHETARAHFCEAYGRAVAAESRVTDLLDRCAALELALLGGAQAEAPVAAPPLPAGTHGVTIAALSTDPPVALLTFDPFGVLGEDVHSEHDETATVIRGAVVVVRAPCGSWRKRDEAIQLGGSISTRISAGETHTLRAGVEGALVLVAMAKVVHK